MDRRRVVRVSGLVLVCATLVACGGADVPRAQAPTGAARVATTAPPTTTTTRLSPTTDLEAVGEGEPFPSGAAYAEAVRQYVLG